MSLRTLCGVTYVRPKTTDTARLHLHERPRIRKFRDRKLDDGCQGLGVEAMGHYCLRGTWLFVWDDGQVLEMVAVVAQGNALNAAELYVQKW